MGFLKALNKVFGKKTKGTPEVTVTEVQVDDLPSGSKDSATKGTAPLGATGSTWAWLRRRTSSAPQTANTGNSSISRMSMVKGLISRTMNMASANSPASNESNRTDASVSGDKNASAHTIKAKKIDPIDDPTIPSTTQTRIAFLSTCGYIIEKDVDSGAFANVYLVRSKDEKKTPFAAKRINMLAKSNKKFIGKFLPREIWSHAQINHACLIRYYQTIVGSTDLYMIMQWIPRGNMLDYCRLNGKLPEKNASIIMYQLCAGLAYMHVNDLCHRDIKCENVLMFSFDPLHIKIADFGFAKFIGPKAHRLNPDLTIGLSQLGARTNLLGDLPNSLDSTKSSIRSRSGSIADYLTKTFCGSLAYSSPELVMGKAYDGRKVDTWSAGCVLFIMLTHRMAFREKMGNRALVQQHLAGVRWPASCSDEISNDAKDLVETILRFNYLDRPFTDELLDHTWFDKVRPMVESNITSWNSKQMSNSRIRDLKSRRRSLSMGALGGEFRTSSGTSY